MKELGEILRAIEEVRASGQEAALATVVHVEGSAYRREGAKLLITARGEMVGSISAGCLEGDVLEWTRRVIERREPVLRRYGLTSEDELVWGFGMGCNGVIDVWIEPLEAARPYLEQVRAFFEQEIPCLGATVVEAPEGMELKRGARLLVPQRGEPWGTLGLAAVDERVRQQAHAVLQGGRSRTVTYDPTSWGWTESEPIRLFMDCFLPLPRLILFGAGADAVPLVRMGKEAGFRVTVVDHRPKFITAERFPQADQLVVAHPEEVPQRLELTPSSYVVLLTHNFHVDAALLGWLLHSPAAYVGLLGPKERRERLLVAVRERGIEVGPDQMARLYAPVGLDIGAEGPEQIALAILSEMLAVRNRRAAGFLRDRQKPIHAE